MSDIDYAIITQTDDLSAFCQRAAVFPSITIDTEFIRERTYYPRLCLIQIATDDEAVIIDPMADGISLEPLIELLNNENVLKVFHAARQDLEIFYHLSGKIPHPVFDTQVAAMVCGFGESVGYEGLVRQLTGDQIDKSSRFTNWAQRPLTQKQLDYAVSDVTHLRIVYAKLAKKLEQTNRISWIKEEMAELVAESTYDVHPEEAWQRLKLRTRSPQFLIMVQAIAQWRETVAQKIDVPRGHVLKDEAVMDIAASKPKAVADLQKIRGMNRGLDKALLQDLIDVVAEAKAKPKSEAPEAPPTRDMPPESRAAIELLRVLLKRQCDNKNVAQKLVATRNELELAAIGKLDQTHLTHGWRWEVFGKQASLLLDGKLGLTLNAKKGAVELIAQDEILD